MTHHHSTDDDISSPLKFVDAMIKATIAQMTKHDSRFDEYAPLTESVVRMAWRSVLRNKFPQAEQSEVDAAINKLVTYYTR